MKRSVWGSKEKSNRESTGKTYVANEAGTKVFQRGKL